MDRKSRLSAALIAARRLEKNFIDILSEDERSAAGSFKAWSAKDTLAHVAVWKQFMADAMHAIFSGAELEIISDIDAANATFYQRYAPLTWGETVGFLERASTQLDDAVQAVDDAHLEDADTYFIQKGRPLWRDVSGNGIIHPMMHLTNYCLEHAHPEFADELQIQIARIGESIDDSQAWRGLILYNLACYHALCGQKERAISGLREALRLAPEITEWSKQDPDLVSLHDERDYREIYAV